MIKDHTIDQCLVELARTMAALKALRAERKERPVGRHSICSGCLRPTVFPDRCLGCGSTEFHKVAEPASRQHAAALRASLDLTRKLADLRQGR